MADTNGSNKPDRLDRVESIIKALADRQHLIEDEFVRLLRAQVVMSDHMEKQAAHLTAIDERLKNLAEAQQRTESHMNSLILTVDDIIRGRKA
jgi:hypothetical protein